MAPQRLKADYPGLAAGIDEAGRGCLAGPVVAAAVIPPPGFHIAGLTDSKLLSPAMRANLEPTIKAGALAWGIGIIWPPRIDRINILQATFEAMAMAVSHLDISPDSLLIDGNQKIPERVLEKAWRKFPGKTAPAQTTVVAGDKHVPAISAASILAKTLRDRIMIRLSRVWPAYGFAQHKGYGTARHLMELGRHGPSPMHRLTFRGVLQQGEL